MEGPIYEDSTRFQQGGIARGKRESSVASVMRGMEAQEAWPAFAFIAAVGGFCVTFLCWRLYFEHSKLADSSLSLQEVRSPARLQCWFYLHLPLYLSLTVAGVGFEHIIEGRHFGIHEAILMSAACASVGCLRRKVGGINACAPSGKTWLAFSNVGRTDSRNPAF